jgi:UDP-N-acetylmuramoyl-L-alanyl-D-glutamate--2,6-diaminopimelate ligase
VPAPSDGAARTLRPAHLPARPLAGLLEHLPQLRADRPAGSVLLTGCTLDSRAVQPGDLYAALPGAHAHGAQFAAAAVAAGAVAVLTDPAGAARCADVDVPVVVVDDPRGVLGQVARWTYDDPGRDLRLLGVTGTNGKTTTAFLLEAGLRAAGHRTGCSAPC